MRIVHVSFGYGEICAGGAFIAVSRIHRGLLAQGVDSVVLCSFKHGRGDGVYEVPGHGILRTLFLFTVRILRKLPWLIGYNQAVALNVVPSGMGVKINELNPDLVTIHWVSADTISLEEISKIKAPVVIVLHDLWFLLGTSPHPGTDTRHLTGFTKENSNLLDRWLWGRKQKMSEQRSICFVAPSNWATNVAKLSVIGRKHRCLSIPNPVDVVLFRFEFMKVKNHEKFTILFGCNGGTSNPYKGFNDLRLALKILPEEIAKKTRLLVFGESAESYSINGIEVSFLGIITKVSDLVDIYHDADMFAFPSKEETQGQTKIEALSCGLPVVAFDRTACAEGIIHKETGWAVKDGDIEGFKDGIVWCYEKTLNKTSFMNERKIISLATHGKYNETIIVGQWLDLYKELIPGSS